MLMDKISGEIINEAIRIYLEHAFRRVPSKMSGVPKFPADATLQHILGGAHPFENLTVAACHVSSADPVPVDGGSIPRVFTLSLGSETFPHMKLALVEVYTPNEFVFAVDRNDTFHIDPEVPGFRAWNELKEINRLLKEVIETAWHKAGIPTLNGLRKDRFKHPDLVRELKAEGQRILVLDDDEARADIMKRMLASVGYDALLGPPGPQSIPEGPAVLNALEKAAGHSLRLPASAAQGAAHVEDLVQIIADQRVALIVLDLSYRTGQGARVATALRLNEVSESVPIFGVYSRRDFGPDPDLFECSIRRPYRSEAFFSLVDQILVHKAPGSSGIHSAVDE